MRTDIDETDEPDKPDKPEMITDPIIKHYGHRLHLLTLELITETQNYELNREQIDQVIACLTTVRSLLFLSDELAALDAMLRMTFPNEYYGENDSVVSMLSTYPLSTSN